MDRRKFIKGVATVSASAIAGYAGGAILLPNQSKAVAPRIVRPEVYPRTCAALRHGMEAAFAGVRHTDRGFVEHLASPAWPGSDQHFVCRVVPVVWVRYGESEAELCAEAWEEFVLFASCMDARDTILWRKVPEITVCGGASWYECSGKVWNVRDVQVTMLRMRFALIPHDYRQSHAFDGSHPAYDRYDVHHLGYFKPEGYV